MPLFLALLLLVLTGFSLYERTHQKKIRMEATGSNVPDPKSSPFSQAVVELVATAGGVYLALIALVNFVQVDVPASIMFLGVKFEPLAGLSLFIALVQPYFTRRNR